MPMIYGCACRLGNHPHHRLSPVDPAISAKDGEPDAEKPNPRGGSPFADYGKKKIGENRLFFIATSGYVVKGFRK